MADGAKARVMRGDLALATRAEPAAEEGRVVRDGHAVVARVKVAPPAPPELRLRAPTSWLWRRR